MKNIKYIPLIIGLVLLIHGIINSIRVSNDISKLEKSTIIKSELSKFTKLAPFEVVIGVIFIVIAFTK